MFENLHLKIYIYQTQENIGMVSIGHIDETSGLQGEVEEERMDEDVDPEDDTESSEVSAKGPEENSEGVGLNFI